MKKLMKNGFLIKQDMHAMVYLIKDLIHLISNITINLKKLLGMKFIKLLNLKLKIQKKKIYVALLET